MRFTSLVALGFITCLSTASVVRAQAVKATNPEFATWSKFKKGTTITLKRTTKQNTTTTESVDTHALTDLGKDKLTLTKSSESTFMGRKEKSPPLPFTVDRETSISPLDDKNDYAVMKPKGTTEEGTETVKIGKTEYKTKWYLASEKTLLGATKQTKVWTSDEVPGMLVKKTEKTDGKNPSEHTVEVTAVTKK